MTFIVNENGNVNPSIIGEEPVSYCVKSVCVIQMYLAISYLLNSITTVAPINEINNVNPTASELELKTEPIINAKKMDIKKSLNDNASVSK